VFNEIVFKQREALVLLLGRSVKLENKLVVHRDLGCVDRPRPARVILGFYVLILYRPLRARVEGSSRGRFRCGISPQSKSGPSHGRSQSRTFGADCNVCRGAEA
jgi:hypothetical protein